MKYSLRFTLAASVFAVTLSFSSAAAATDVVGFEIGNGQFFGPGGTFSWIPPTLNGLYGKYYDKQSAGSRTRFKMRTFSDVTYEAFRDLRRQLEPKGWESIQDDHGLDAMEREGFGHGEGRCVFEIRFLNKKQALVSAEYEAVPDCTIEHAMSAVHDSLQSLNWIK